MKSSLFSFTCLLFGISILSFSNPARAQLVIYSDTFTTGINGSAIAGRTPDGVNLTNGTYVARTRTGTAPTLNTAFGNPPGSAATNINAASGLSLASGGSFTRTANASAFTISADLSLGGITGFGAVTSAGASTRGVELGYYTTLAGLGSNDANEGFTGFAFQNAGGGNGILQFVKNGVSTGFSSLTVLSGTLSTSAFYNLSYTVDTSTGNLLSASFNNVDIFSSFSTSATGAFTDAATAFGGFGASSTTGGVTGNVDNFSIVAVIPEPSSAALCVMSGGALMFLLRRHRSHRAA